jgi:hypothetical protein
VVLCGAGLPPLLTKILLGGGFVWAFEDFGSRLRDGDDDAGGGARGRRPYLLA